MCECVLNCGMLGATERDGLGWSKLGRAGWHTERLPGTKRHMPPARSLPCTPQGRPPTTSLYPKPKCRSPRAAFPVLLQRRLIGGIGLSLALGAFALVPTEKLQAPPSKPLFFYLVPLLRVQVGGLGAGCV